MKTTILLKIYLKKRSWLRLNERLKGDIGKIDYLLDKYSYILKGVTEKDPEDRDLLAISNLLHTFYNGVERLFIAVAEEYDNSTISRRQFT